MKAFILAILLVLGLAAALAISEHVNYPRECQEVIND